MSVDYSGEIPDEFYDRVLRALREEFGLDDSREAE